MKRTINERKAWERIFIVTPIWIILMGMFGLAAKNGDAILGTISTFGIISAIITLTSSAYSLGWEYKKIQMEGEKE